MDAGEDYWNDGLGWEPVDCFDAVFDGGGRSISNLFIRRADEDHVGLFGYTGTSASIKNVALASADVVGESFVGVLAGSTRGTITTSFVSGDVRGKETAAGLVGGLDGTVSSSYSSADVVGTILVGGLVGYVSGSVNNSYSSGSVEGSGTVGGLVGLLHPTHGSIVASYWDTETSQQSDSGGGVGKTTTELQQPTGYIGIFSTWDDHGADVWHFGTCTNYPALKIDRDGDDVSTWEEFGGRGRLLRRSR